MSFSWTLPNTTTLRYIIWYVHPHLSVGWANKEDKRKLFLSMTRVHVHVYIRKSVYTCTFKCVLQWASEPGYLIWLWLYGIASFGSVSNPSLSAVSRSPLLTPPLPLSHFYVLFRQGQRWDKEQMTPPLLLPCSLGDIDLTLSDFLWPHTLTSEGHHYSRCTVIRYGS